LAAVRRGARSEGGDWLVLAVVLVGAFMAILDVAIVNVAIPSIRSDLHTSFGAVELVITGYTITYACLLVTGGRLGDILGRRRMFIAGILVFTAASAACGVAPSVGVLVAARAVQGIGGALLYPQVLSIIQVTFTGEQRGRALAVFGSTLGLAAIAGQIIGGLLLEANLFGLTWRPVFLVNIPLGLLAAIAAARVLPREHRAEATTLDEGGVVLVAFTILLLIVPLLEGREEGWPAWMIACLVAAPLVAAVFVAYEHRVARGGGAPLLHPQLFRNRSFAGGVPIAALFLASYAGFLITLAVYLQIGLGFTPLQAGLTYTPSAVGFFITSLLAPRLVPLLGRAVLTLGYLIAALGLLATAATAGAAGAGVTGWELAPALFIAGLGQGLGMTPLVGTIISGLEPEDAGAGSGVVTTTLQIGNALGVAVTSLIFFTILGSSHGAGHYASTFAATLPVSAVLLLAAATLVHRLPRGPQQASNALIERLPGWASGLAYSMFLMTGGRMGDRMFEEVLGHVAELRERRMEAAPLPPGEFLAFNFDEGRVDGAWLNYLLREALTYGAGEVPHERERQPVIDAQVDEVRRRQAEGLVDPELDPRLLRLLGFALVSYPRLLPQVTRMVTGLPPDDPRFIAEWEDFLRAVGDRFAPAQEAAES
jgi:EmrB/QacA subfamily drug resistance transporter